jgi:hypothetical protein
MLWNMAEVDGAANLLLEMSIPEPVPGTSARSQAPPKAAATPPGR